MDVTKGYAKVTQVSGLHGCREWRQRHPFNASFRDEAKRTAPIPWQTWALADNSLALHRAGVKPGDDI
jgi:hypothetical protein